MKEQGFLDIHGVALEYRWIQGEEDRPLLILLHEGLGCVKMWKDFPEALAAATKCNVFLYSRQGYGGSDSYPLPRSVHYMHDEAKILKLVLDELPVTEYILIGHSDGASIAAIFSGSYSNSFLKKLVLIAPHFFVEAITSTSIQAAKERYENTDLGQRLSRYHGPEIDAIFSGWTDIWLSPAFKNWNICKFLPSIQIPTLVFQGDEDEYGTQEQVETARRLITGSVTTRFFENCGHSPQVVCEQETIEAIKDFVT